MCILVKNGSDIVLYNIGFGELSLPPIGLLFSIHTDFSVFLVPKHTKYMRVLHSTKRTNIIMVIYFMVLIHSISLTVLMS